MRRLNNKGFSFIELLGVVVIMGVILLLAIPSISRLIVDARKQAYIDAVIIQKNTVEAAITSDRYYVYDKETVYYFDYKMFSDEDDRGRSPFGDWVDCYVVVTYDGKDNHFYWTGLDSNGWKIDLRKQVSKLTTKDVYHSSSTNFIPGNTVGARDNVVIYKDGEDEPTEQTPSNDVSYADAVRCFDLEQLADGTYRITGYNKACGTDVGVPSSVDGKQVTKIGENAFRSKGLTSVVLYYGITEIENGAFQNNSIKDVKLSSTVKIIGPHAFLKNQIQALDLPEGVEVIDTFSFATNQIRSVTFPKSLRTIGSYAFQGNLLTEFELNSNAYIGGAAFSGNQIPEASALIYRYDATKGETDYTTIIGYGGASKNIVIPDKVNGVEPLYITSNAFASSGITSVYIPASIRRIYGDAFAFNSISSLTFAPNSKLTQIDSGAFRSNKLTTINIPSSVTSIGSYAFNTNKVTGEAGIIYARNSDGSVDYSKIVSYAGGGIAGGITIPAVKNGVKLRSIVGNAFADSNLTSITLPNLSQTDGLTIANDAFIRNRVSGDAGFIYKISGGNVNYEILSSYAGPTGGVNGTITIPKTSHGKDLKRIEAYFTWMSYSKVIIPESVESISYANFSKTNRNNTSLKTIVNKTGRAFDWYTITGSTHPKPNPVTFKTGTVSHQSGNLNIVSS